MTLHVSNHEDYVGHNGCPYRGDEHIFWIQQKSHYKFSMSRHQIVTKPDHQEMHVRFWSPCVEPHLPIRYLHVFVPRSLFPFY